VSQAPMMPVWPDALLGDTLDLSVEQFGAYLLLLFATWRNNGEPLPDDDAKLARICRCSVPRWRRTMRPAIIRFFVIDGAGLHQKRLEKEWALCAMKREKTKISGAAGGTATALKKHKSTISERYSERYSERCSLPIPRTLENQGESLVIISQSPRAHTRTREATPPDTATRPSPKILKKILEGEAEPAAAPGEIPEGWLTEAEAARDEAQLEPVNLLLEWGKFAARADGPVELRRWIEWSLRAWVSREPKPKTNGSPPIEAVAETPWAARVRQWQLDGWWLPSFGPKPGEPGCFVPPQYLAEAAE